MSAINVSLRELQTELRSREDSGDFKTAAIFAFVLAKRMQKDGLLSSAESWARKCLELLTKFPTDTEEQCASPYLSVSGVPIPGLFHEGTVRRDLAPLAL